MAKDLEVMMQTLSTAPLNKRLHFVSKWNCLTIFIFLQNDSIRRTVDKKLVDICSEFNSFVNDAKHHFEHMKSKPIIGKAEPKFGGAARWAYGLSMEVRREWNSFNNAKNVWADNMGSKSEVDDAFGKLVNVFQSLYQGNTPNGW